MKELILETISTALFPLKVEQFFRSFIGIHTLVLDFKFTIIEVINEKARMIVLLYLVMILIFFVPQRRGGGIYLDS